MRAILLILLILFNGEGFCETSENNTTSKCRLNFKDGSYFEGVCIDNNIPIRGSIKTPSGDIMEGKFDGKHYGDFFQGTITYNNFVVLKDEGNFEHFNLQGNGKRTFPDGTIYEGNFEGGHPTNGTLKYTDGTVYKGSFKDRDGNLQFVMGEKIWSNGTKDKGSFKNWGLYGFGLRIFPDKTQEESYFIDGVANGKSKIKFSNGSVLEGNRVNGEPDGPATLITNNGKKILQNYKSGVLISGSQAEICELNFLYGRWSKGKPNNISDYTLAKISHKDSTGKNDVRITNIYVHKDNKSAKTANEFSKFLTNSNLPIDRECPGTTQGTYYTNFDW